MIPSATPASTNAGKDLRRESTNQPRAVRPTTRTAIVNPRPISLARLGPPLSTTVHCPFIHGRCPARHPRFGSRGDVTRSSVNSTPRGLGREVSGARRSRATTARGVTEWREATKYRTPRSGGFTETLSQSSASTTPCRVTRTRAPTTLRSPEWGFGNDRYDTLITPLRREMTRTDDCQVTVRLFGWFSRPPAFPLLIRGWRPARRGRAASARPTRAPRAPAPGRSRRSSP